MVEIKSKINERGKWVLFLSARIHEISDYIGKEDKQWK